MASIAFVPAFMGFVSAPCSLQVGPSRSVPRIILAASRSGAARSFIAANGWRSPLSSAFVMPAFLPSSAMRRKASRKSPARVSEVLSFEDFISTKRFLVFDAPVASAERCPNTKADISVPSEVAPSEWMAKRPAEPPFPMMYSPTWSCDKAPFSQRMRRHVLGEGTHRRMRASSPLPLTRSGMWMP